MIDLSPDVLKLLGVAAGSGVTVGLAVVGRKIKAWAVDRLEEIVSTSRETKRDVSDLKNGVMESKIERVVDKKIQPLIDAQGRLESKFEVMLALMPRSTAGDD